MSAIKINKQVIEQILEKPIRQATEPYARRAARTIFNERKTRFFDEFEDSEVTQELKVRGESDIDGVRGNLFSFIGFDAGSDPIGDLRRLFRENISLSDDPSYNNKSKTFTFNMFIPTVEQIKETTDMGNYNSLDNWGVGRSWVYMLERGIPGLSYYYYSRSQKALGGESRSGQALQRKNSIRDVGNTLKRTDYISKLLRILREKF